MVSVHVKNKNDIKRIETKNTISKPIQFKNGIRWWNKTKHNKNKNPQNSTNPEEGEKEEERNDRVRAKYKSNV